MSQKYVRNFTKFILIVLRIQKNKCNFHYVAMPMMTPQIFKSVNFTKTQKSRYFKNKTFFLQKKTKTIAHQGLLYAKKCFTAEVIFSRRPPKKKKIVEEKSLPPPGKCFPQKCNLPSYESKNSHFPQSSWEICSPSIQNVKWGRGRGH